MTAPNQSDINKQFHQAMYLDMATFGQICLKDTFKNKIPDFHRTLYNTFHDESKKKILIVAPRHHAKSSVAGLVLPLHHILYGEGHRLVVLVSRTQGHAVRLLNTIKDALSNDQVRKFFGDWSETTAKKWTESEVILKDDSMIIALGTGQQLRGMKHGNQRPTLVILDDPEDEENTKTIDAMNHNFEWLLKAAVPALADDGRIVVIGTVIHQYCIVSRLKKAVGWEKHWYKAVQDDEKSVLWEDKWSLKRLMELKEEYASIGKLSVWYQEFQNEIFAPEDQPFREEFFKFYDHELKILPEQTFSVLMPKEGSDEAPIPVNLYMGIDPASSVSDTADYSAVCVVGISHDNKAYVIDYLRKRMHPMDLAEKILEMHNKYKPNGINIETIGYQEMLRDYLRNQNLWLPGIERKNQPRAAKSVRLLSMQPRMIQGGLFMKESMNELKEEFIQYNPDKRNNRDDLLDSLYYALKNTHPCPVVDWERSISPTKRKSNRKYKVDWRTI